MANNYTNVFTGSLVQPIDVSYLELALTQNTQLVWAAYATPDMDSSYAVAARNIDTTPSIAGLMINLPQANAGALGTDILITNRGSIPFIVADYNSVNTTVVAPNASIYFYLIDNSTVGGVWRNEQFGAGTSSADANALSGAGLISLGGKINKQIIVNRFSDSGHLLTESDRARAYVWTGGVGTITLPSASNISTGWTCYIRNNGSGTLTVIPTDVNSLIDGVANVPFQLGTSAIIAFEQQTGNFYTLGTVGAQNFSFSSATYNVDSVPSNTLSLTNGAPIIERYVALSGTRTQDLLVSLPATTQFYSFINAISSSAYTIRFQIQGSVQTPISVPSNTQSFVVSDGINLYVLNSTSIGTFQLANGSASAPALSFLDEPSTGIYKQSPYRLGISSGATSMMIFDGTDANNPRIQSVATATFKSIDGGLI